MSGTENSNTETVLQVQNLSKTFPIYDNPARRLMELMLPWAASSPKQYQALDDISFSLKKGETVGIVGQNGAGKSTLLQCICNTLTPSSGDIHCKGKIAALLELGAGFNPEFTGRENIYLNGSIYGLTNEQMEERFDSICAFADIGEFIEQPVKTYSSGMFVRLAFAVIVHVDADILIIDEALAVGDALFSQKCMRFLEDFKENGSILFVSHDSSAVTRLCDRAIWLEKGKLRCEGTAKEVTEGYLEHIYAKQQDISISTFQSPPEEPMAEHVPEFEYWHDGRQDFLAGSSLRNDIKLQPFDTTSSSFGTGKAEIIDVFLRNEDGKKLSYAVGGEKAVVEIRFRALEELQSVIVGFLFKTIQGQVLFGDNSYLSLKNNPVVVKAGQVYKAQFAISLPYLVSAEYVMSAGVASGTQDEHVQHCWCHDALVMNVLSDHMVHGLIGLHMSYCHIKPV
ncbi:ABC transporter ATP-binding protein [Pseudoteredinibacter isoporae]|uniref:Lipopolysaccharide transport system ATP-binding protein n=1 Tax=Pseudoteredinibacter isoporae TaxID=570281 RepID=A0A7X0JPV1_9GAMM|nr:ABC transporter ATP-binding protein [Pseudoteredinibacter isoporae]MBB6520108.1 lipopolysaccharide transport system ATP-binding protein [Pseudoteredinibacter isoporae]NHO85680.1 ABC transporter ATP-binding protein [Pseudoteredinibacter isoporae]NIB25868.1 ABC transporter ATP-binding protein [Pseudoteredinibacter isoporae]